MPPRLQVLEINQARLFLFNLVPVLPMPRHVLSLCWSLRAATRNPVTEVGCPSIGVSQIMQWHAGWRANSECGSLHMSGGSGGSSRPGTPRQINCCGLGRHGCTCTRLHLHMAFCCGKWVKHYGVQKAACRVVQKLTCTTAFPPSYLQTGC